MNVVDVAPDLATAPNAVRLVNMHVIRTKICPVYFRPVPCADTLHGWFKAARIVRFKSNPDAKFGGGRIYYRAAEVEQFFRQRAGI